MTGEPPPKSLPLYRAFSADGKVSALEFGRSTGLDPKLIVQTNATYSPLLVEKVVNRLGQRVRNSVHRFQVGQIGPRHGLG